MAHTMDRSGRERFAKMIAAGIRKGPVKVVKRSSDDPEDDEDMPDEERDETKDDAVAAERCGEDLKAALDDGDGKKIIEALKAALEYC